MTAQEVFDIAICLMDAQNEASGATDTPDTREYRVRACSLLNSVLDRVYPASDTYPGIVDGARPVCPKLSALSDTVALDESICTGVLPYALAALLLSSENPTLANYFQQSFEQNLLAARVGRPCVSQDVQDLYGGVEKGEFAQQ